MDLRADLSEFINQAVVLDTMGHLVFIGTLSGVTENGFWLSAADVHDCRDGHASKEQYVAEARIQGIAVNRKRVFVMHSAVCSLSLLEAIGAEEEPSGGPDAEGVPVKRPHGPAGLSTGQEAVDESHTLAP